MIYSKSDKMKQLGKVMLVFAFWHVHITEFAYWTKYGIGAQNILDC